MAVAVIAALSMLTRGSGEARNASRLRRPGRRDAGASRQPLSDERFTRSTSIGQNPRDAGVAGTCSPFHGMHHHVRSPDACQASGETDLRVEVCP